MGDWAGSVVSKPCPGWRGLQLDPGVRPRPGVRGTRTLRRRNVTYLKKRNMTRLSM